MKVRIHRGAHEIGGTCIEVEAGGARILLDLGQPLDVPDSIEVPVPDVPGLRATDPSLLGLLISHGHQDHWGLAGHARPDLPVYIGEAACRILKEAVFFSTSIDLRPQGYLRHREPFGLGPFRITPFLNDHSAFDTYSLLIEADGRRLLYSADFQAHGRKAGVFEAFLRNPPPDVDVLLLEGTSLRPHDETRSGLTERGLEVELVRAFTAAPGLVLAMYSAQNIDRLVTMFRACLQSRRHLVVDLYTASLAAAAGNPRIPQVGFDRLLVYVPLRQRIRVKKSREFDRTERIRPVRIFPEHLAARSHELVLTFRTSMIREVESAGCLAAATAVWSMWPGYLSKPGQERLLSFFERHAIPLLTLHASGHAYVKDLQRFARAVAPKRIVPIHTSAPERFPEAFERVECHADGEWWTV